MIIYKTKWFERWAIKEGLSDQMLVATLAEIEQGNIDAHLGGNVIKKRVAIGSRGKSGGLRTILAFKSQHSVFYIFGFAKNEQANISSKELQALKLLAQKLLNYDNKTLSNAIKTHELIEVKK